MIPLAVFREWFDYNYWARDRQLQVCSRLTPEQWLRPLGNSYSSIRDTLAHMAGGEWVWLERCRGESPRSLPAASEFPDLEAITKYWNSAELGFREFLNRLPEEALLFPVSYTGFTGDTWRYPLWRVLMHVMNHQSYHRGQVTMLLRLLGAEPIPVDLLVADDAGLFKDQQSTPSASQVGCENGSATLVAERRDNSRF